MTHLAAFVRAAIRPLLAGAALSLLTTPTRAQEAAQPVGASPARPITVKLMPLGLADPWTPTFRFGAEYRLSPAWGVEASYGLQLRNLGWGSGGFDSYQSNRYHKVHAEARRYFAASPFYVAGAGFAVTQRAGLPEGLLYLDGQYWSHRGATLRRTVLGGLAKGGVVLPLNERWSLDLALGVGLRRLAVDYLMQRPEFVTPDFGPYWDETNCQYPTFSDFGPRTTPGITWRPTVAFDVRLGYVLGR